MSGCWAMGNFVIEVGVAVGAGVGFWVNMLVETADFLAASVVLEGIVLLEMKSVCPSDLLVLRGVWGKTMC